LDSGAALLPQAFPKATIMENDGQKRGRTIKWMKPIENIKDCRVAHVVESLKGLGVVVLCTFSPGTLRKHTSSRRSSGPASVVSRASTHRRITFNIHSRPGADNGDRRAVVTVHAGPRPAAATQYRFDSSIRFFVKNTRRALVLKTQNYYYAVLINCTCANSLLLLEARRQLCVSA
jgi:hypothetical protein